MSKAEKTRQYIIEKTAVLFNTKGYAGTSLSDITEATGLTKGSIYGNFENKDDVSKAVYLFNSIRLQAELDTYCNSQTSAYDKLMAMLDFHRYNWKNNFERGGCPLLNTAIEADDTMPALKEEVAKSFAGWAQKIMSIIESGKSNREFKATVSTEQHAYTFIMLIEGGILLSKTTNNQNHLFQALDRIVKIIDDELVI